MNIHNEQFEPDINSIENKLENYLKNNASNSLTRHEDEKHFVLAEPWGDSSLELVINDEDAEIIDILNRIKLPERYSAIFHLNTNKLEVAYTIFPKEKIQDDLRNREFRFQHKTNNIKCYYATSSHDLLHISKHCRPVGGSGRSGYRNLMPFNTYMLIQDGDLEASDEYTSLYKNGEPVSFWIDVNKWDEDEILDIIYHLNFFMSYFDRKSPNVLIHNPEQAGESHNEGGRYLNGGFPSHIQSRDINRHLLQLWQAGQQGDAARRYLYNYQIIEYSAFSIIDDEIYKNIRRMVSAPDCSYRATEVAYKVIDAINSSKMHDSQKIDHIVAKTVDPTNLWKIIELNKNIFSKPQLFEGGFLSTGLIKDSWRQSDFENNWASVFSKSIRDIRNALSHGKEQKSSVVIAPTAANMRLLAPWVSLVAVAAHDVMVYHYS